MLFQHCRLLCQNTRQILELNYALWGAELTIKLAADKYCSKFSNTPGDLLRFFIQSILGLNVTVG